MPYHLEPPDPSRPRGIVRLSHDPTWRFNMAYDAAFMFEADATDPTIAVFEAATGKFPIMGFLDRSRLAAELRALGFRRVRWRRFEGRDHGGTEFEL